MDESLVAFAMEYHLNLRDIIHLSAREQRHPYPSAAQLGMEERILALNPKDSELYSLASQALDARIARLRNSRGFDEALALYKKVQAAVDEACEGLHGRYGEQDYTRLGTYYGQEGMTGRWCVDNVLQQMDGMAL
jgi:hypothetical protein